MEKTVYLAGVGGIGSQIAWQFFASNYPCKLLLKDKAQYEKYNQDGLKIYYDDQMYQSRQAASVIGDLKESIKYIIICVKAYDILNVIKSIENNLEKDSVIVIVCNGMGIIEEIEKRYPTLRIISGLSYRAAYKEDQFTIHSFSGGPFRLGVSLGKFKTAEIEAIKEIFLRIEIPFSWEEDIQPHIWKKFAINCCVNMISVFYDCKYKDLLQHLDELRQLSEEVVLVLNNYNVKISSQELYSECLRLLSLIGESYSSTWQDVKNRKPTELRYLNGYLIALAQKKNIHLKLNLKLYNALKKRGVLI